MACDWDLALAVLLNAPSDGPYDPDGRKDAGEMIGNTIDIRFEGSWRPYDSKPSDANKAEKS